MPDLTEIREALAKATPGPWRAGVLAPCHTGVWGTQPDTDWNVCLTGDELTHYSIEDAHLIANAPAWLESLCDEVEQLRGEVTREQMERSDAVIRAEKAEAAVDIAASIIDDARHALAPERPGPRIEPAKRVLWSEDAHKIVTAWADRKRIASCHIPPRLGQRHALDGE